LQAFRELEVHTRIEEEIFYPAAEAGRLFLRETHLRRAAQVALVLACRIDRTEPVAHLGAAVDLPVGAGVELNQERPGAVGDAVERPFPEMPDEGHARIVHQD
jgi:hypothetical protein